ncbi:PspA/IM30 family protein [[Phormidium] sp. ETS-05]|uniref:PspA/IM30 family protein n=1 Tax=[Phormidium] sp. ETS-05 TaxID=222819 RepID=UPI0018EF083F|nr:PspA/IM30 family protein [[Phormidium] sp. ETS-05]
MKKVIYWLVGEKAGRTIIGTWNWLWGMPVESGGKVAVQTAEEALRDMQASVQKLSEAVAIQVGAYQKAKQKYQAKAEEMQRLERQAITAQKLGNQEAARMAISKVIQIEQLLPQLETQVQQAETYVKASQEKLQRERLKLEAYKADMQNMKDITEINEALATMAKVNSDLNIDSARSQFEAAKSAVERRHLQQQALADLSENPAEKLQADLEKMTLDDAVSQRLKMLESSTEQSN